MKGLLMVVLVAMAAMLAGCQAPVVAPPSGGAEAITPPAVAQSAPAAQTPVPAPTGLEQTGEATTMPATPNSLPSPVPAQFAPVQNAAGAIAYSDGGLCLAFPETGETVRLHTMQPESNWVDYGFSWSPDGRRIAFVQSPWGPPEGYRIGYLMLADLERGEVRALVDEPAPYSRPAWSPDGERLAFMRLLGQGVGELAVLHVASGELTILAGRAFGRSWQAPSWLGNERIAYLRGGGESSDGNALVSQALNEAEPQAIVQCNCSFFALSPDQRRLAYNSGSEILVADIESAGAPKSAGVMPEGAWLQWSPDGRYLLGYAGLASIHLGKPEEAMRQLAVMGVPGQAQAWAPDGRRFALLLGGDGKPAGSGSKLAIYDVDKDELRELPIVVGMPWEAAWSPR